MVAVSGGEVSLSGTALPGWGVHAGVRVYPDGALLPGMIARVRADRALTDAAMVIPQDWLVTRRSERGVFVTSGDIAEWRDVTLGDVIHDQVVVTSGLSEGDRVVITGHRDLVDGDPLIVSREGRCCAAGRPSFEE